MCWLIFNVFQGYDVHDIFNICDFEQNERHQVYQVSYNRNGTFYALKYW